MIIRALALLFLLFYPHQAMALSCAEPVVDEKAIEQTDLIFEGEILEILEKEENKDPEATVNKYTTYKFSVKKLWKGAITSKEVYISKNTYWGDGFEIDTPYLVFANKEEERFVSGLCGPTRNLNYADDELMKLEKYIPTNKKED